MQYLAKKQRNFHNKHPKLNSSNAILKLINGYFWRSLSGPFLSFVFPLIIILILGYTIGYNTALPGAFLLGIIVIGLNVLPSTILDFKQSSLLKRIGVTPISSRRILLSICFFYLLIMILSTVVVTCISLLFFTQYWNVGSLITVGEGETSISINLPSIKTILTNVDWGGYCYNIFICIILSISTGLAFASIFRTPTTIQSVSVMLMIIVILSSGLAVPNQISVSNKVIWFGGYITPFKPIINCTYEAWNGTYKQNGLDGFDWNPDWRNFTNLYGSSIFDFKKTYAVYSTIVLPGSKMGPIQILTTSEKYVNISVPYAWLSVLIIVIAKKFRWTGR